ncbi:MAG: hypothetical protein P4L61_02500 [Candidatus Pacebacteria bacterium]|nr:hypothetical protein [Candidatus Paceibacterota bacterium]
MNKVEEVLIGILTVYVVIGATFGASYSITYNPSIATNPNNFTTFLQNVILWPLNAF